MSLNKSNIAYCQKFILLFFMFIGLFLVFGKGMGSANHSVNGLFPDPGTSIPSATRNALEKCDDSYHATGNSPGVTGWISDRGTASNTTVDVAPGASSVDLQVNYAGAYCVDPSSTMETRYKVVQIISNTITGLINEQSQLIYPGPTNGQVGSYAQTSRGFTYSPPGGFPTAAGTYTYEVKVGVKAINRFASGAHNCVGGTEATVSNRFDDADWSKCSATTPNYIINIKIAAPDKTWELRGATGVSPTSGAVGSVAPFKHTIRNNGPDTASGWIYVTHFANYNASGTLVGQGSISALSNTTGSASLTNGQTVTKDDNFTIPSTWTAGYKRCEWISYDNYKSPTPSSPTFRTSQGTSGIANSPQGVQSATTCYTVSGTSASPTGVITGATCSSTTTGTVTASFNDPDGATQAYITINGVQQGTQSGTSGSWTVGIPSNGVGSIQLFVKDVGSGSSGAFISADSGTISNAACSSTGAPCPGDPNIAANTNVTVSLPDQTPSPQNGPGSQSNFANQQYTQYTPEYKTKVTQIFDTSGGVGQNTPGAVPTLVSDSNYQQATLNYKPFVTGWPYDPNSSSVKYDTYYKTTRWYTKSSPDAPYTCDEGYGSLSGTRCNYQGYPNGWSCPSGYYHEGYGSCRSTTKNGTYYSGSYCSAYNTNGTCKTTTCYSPGTGTNCSYQDYTYTSGTPNNWYCYSSSHSGGGSSPNCSYSATPHWYWHADAPIGNKTIENTVAAYAMNACFERGFEVSEVLVNANYAPDNEDPTSVQAVAFAKANFVIPAGYPNAPNGLRNPVSVAGINSSASASGYAGGCPVKSANVGFNGAYSLPDFGRTGNFSDPDYACNVKSPPLAAGDRVCVTYTLSPRTGRIGTYGNTISGTTSGSIPGTNCTAPLTNQPYVNFFGLDVATGGQFATSGNKCIGGSAGTVSGIEGFVRDSNPLTRGSSAQFGALSAGPVNGFGSASIRPGPTLPTAIGGLTFANSGTLGNVGTTTRCVPDYFSTKDSATTLTPGNDLNVNSSSFNSNSGGSATEEPMQFWYQPPSPYLTLRSPVAAGQGIGNGRRVAIYVEGNVMIENNIKFRSDSWNDPADVPSFYLIVKGNIYISPGVTQLDGIYVAQKNSAGAGGTIRTCADPGSGGGRFNNASVYTSCLQQLVVNGAFVAEDVKLDRTFASLRNSVGGEQPLVPATAASCNVNTSKGERSTPAQARFDCAAEVFTTGPDQLIKKPGIRPAGGETKVKYDYITTLSPVL